MDENPMPRRRGRNEHYLITVRLQAVRLVEGGMPRRDVLQQFGISGTSLRDWRRDYASGQLTSPIPFPRFTQAQDQVARAVRAYNELRPHGSCDFLTPAQAHEREGPLVQRWKNYYHPAPAAKTLTNPYLTPM